MQRLTLTSVPAAANVLKAARQMQFRLLLQAANKYDIIKAAVYAAAFNFDFYQLERIFLKWLKRFLLPQTAPATFPPK